MPIQSVGVAGCGLMGSGIAQICAQSGYDVVMYDIEQQYVDRGMSGIQAALNRNVDKGRLSADERTAILARLHPTTDRSSFATCQLVVEAIIENLNIKRSFYSELDTICPAETIFTSNTSSIPIIELATATNRPDRFAGLHFFNPVPVMELVEIIRSIAVSDETIATLKAFTSSLGKTAVEAKDTCGFIVNRLLIPYLLDAIHVYEAGLATREDIDQGMKLGCSHPMGPLTLCDFIGLDTIQSIAEVMYEEFKEPRFASPPLLKRMVQAKRLGRKSGMGFYDYT